MKQSWAIPVIATALVAALPLAAQQSQPAGHAESWEYGTTFALLVTCDPALLPAGSYLPVRYLLDAGIIPDSFAQVMTSNRLTATTVSGVGGLYGGGMSSGALTDTIPEVPRLLDSPVSAMLGWAGARNVIMVSVSLTAQNTASSSHWSAVAGLIRDRLELQLREMHKSEMRRAEELVERAAVETHALEDKLRAMRMLRSELVSAAEFGDLSRDSVVELARRTQKDRQEITLKVEHLSARQMTLQKMVAEAAEEAKNKASQENPVVQAYKLKLEAVQRKLEEAKSRHQSGLIPGSELREVEVQLATAKAELAGKIQEVMDASGGKRLPALNDELFKNTLDLVEAQTHKEALAGQIERMKRLMALADKYEAEVGSQLPGLEKTYQAVSERQRQLQRNQADMQPPTVRLLGR